jgi:hypothetical protein
MLQKRRHENRLEPSWLSAPSFYPYDSEFANIIKCMNPLSAVVILASIEQANG